MKSLLTFTITLFLTTPVLANVPQVKDQEIESFRNECLTEGAVEDSTCIERYQALSKYVEENQHLEAPTSDNVCIAKNGEIVPVAIDDLANEVDDLSTKLTCNEKDEEYVQDHCGKQMACNMGRSVVTIVDSVAPSFISDKVQRSLASLLSAEEGSSCMDKDQPDCLSEVYRAFISSLVATFNSLRDIGKAIKGAFSNMRAYLFEKTEDLHAAADTAEEETTSFFESPGKYIMEKLSSFKTGIDTWIKEQVFCQKWEGEPHSENSKCVEPLQGYGCLDCNDGINAFCAGAGFFISEGLLTVATAGTFTGLGIAARAGGQVARAATLKGASALTARVPSLAKLANRGAKTTRRTGGQGRRLLAAASNRYSRAKESVAKFGEILAQTRLARATTRVAEVATKPMQYVDNLSNKAMERVLGRAARFKGNNALSRAIRETARQDFRAVRMANRGEDVVTTSAGRASRSLSGARVVRVTNRNRTSSNTRGNNRDNKDNLTGDAHSHTQSHSDDKRTQPQTTGSDDNRDRNRGLESPEDKRKREERERIAQDERRKEEQRREDQRREDEQHRKEEDEDDNGTLALSGASTVVKATRIAVAADLAAKGIRSVDAAASEAVSDQAIQSILDGEQVSGEGSIEDQVNERTGANFQSEAEARKFAQNMGDVYNNPENKKHIIDRLIRERRLSQTEADRVYNSEKDFYQKFGKASPQGGTLTKRYQKQREEIDGLLDRISVMKKNIQIQEVEANNTVAASPAATQNSSETLEEVQAESRPRRVAGTPTPRVPTTSQFSTGSSSSGSTYQASQSSQDSSEEGFISETQEQTVDSDVNSNAENNAEVAAKDGRSPSSVKGEQAEEESPEKAMASQKRMEVMEFLSLLLLEAETGKLSFRAPTSSEKELVSKASASLKRNLELEKTQVVTLGNPSAPYYLFKDFQNGRTIVVDSHGHALEGVPNDII